MLREIRVMHADSKHVGVWAANLDVFGRVASFYAK
jgi:hypothetical protein